MHARVGLLAAIAAVAMIAAVYCLYTAGKRAAPRPADGFAPAQPAAFDLGAAAVLAAPPGPGDEGLPLATPEGGDDDGDDDEGVDDFARHQLVRGSAARDAQHEAEASVRSNPSHVSGSSARLASMREGFDPDPAGCASAANAASAHLTADNCFGSACLHLAADRAEGGY